MEEICAQKSFKVQRSDASVSRCLPRGLESCRYGGTVGVTFSELGPDSSGDRSSMPSEAMSFRAEVGAERRRGERRLLAGTESSRSSEEQPGGWWSVGAVLLQLQQQQQQQRRGRQPGGGGAWRPSPPLSDLSRGGLRVSATRTAVEFWSGNQVPRTRLAMSWFSVAVKISSEIRFWQNSIFFGHFGETQL